MTKPDAPCTEALLQRAFSEAALITAKAAAALIGMDEKTLKAMTINGQIRAVSIGKTVRYPEAAIRDFLYRD